MKKVSSIFSILLSLSFTLAAQSDSITYNLHLKEVSIDFQNFFKGSGTIGSSLVYKKRIDMEENTSLERTKALRLRLGGFINADINSKESIETEFENITEGNGIIESENNLPPGSHFSVFVLSGIEWQSQKKRFQYYTGFEGGYGFEKESIISNINYSGNQIRFINSKNDRNHSILLNGLAGCKFFLSRNFSIGIETSIESSYNIIRNTQTFDDRLIDSKRIITTKNHNFLLGIDYLNALYLSYYF